MPPRQTGAKRGDEIEENAKPLYQYQRWALQNHGNATTEKTSEDFCVEKNSFDYNKPDFLNRYIRLIANR